MKEKLVNSLTKDQLREVIRKVDPEMSIDKTPFGKCRSIVMEFPYASIVASLPKPKVKNS